MPSTVSRSFDATPTQIWDVLTDGWLYGLWVVGASRIRSVDDAWPEDGAVIHHSVGSWPALIDDTTSVVSSVPLKEIKLQARAWPGGEATVLVTIEPQGAGSLVSIIEDASHGPAKFIPGPLRRGALHLRNRESLDRLAYLVAGRSRRAQG